MATKRKVSELKSKILQPALTSHYEVRIFTPPGLTSSNANLSSYDQDLMTVYCTEASLPGSSLNTFEINNDYNGATERHAYRRMYDERIDLTFYVDGRNYLSIKFFELWMDYIDGSIDPDNLPPATGDDLTSEEITETKPKLQRDYTYRVRYPKGAKGYQADHIEITKFEKDYNRRIRYDFLDAYPIAINSMPISYDGSDLLKCTVGISYKRYVMHNVYNPDTSKSIKDELSSIFAGIAPDAGDANDGGGILPLDQVIIGDLS